MADVAEFGWHVVGVDDNPYGPDYAFSVGLYHTLGHPEILIMGLPHETAAQLINVMGESIRGGQRYERGKRYDDIAEGYPLAFVPVAPRYYPDYLGYALWFYRGWHFPTLQCIWPDKQGLFPWDPGYDSRYFDHQRVLG
ncbi:MAG TPA: DUF4262 domain-containing protein [Gemmataceae bacterium]|nr:DUF4262 domain-containing protein [Gemmataceae bacterium]